MGLLRPATPLSVIFFVAFVLLLLSTISTPVIHAIPLGARQGYNFGVFGYCKGDVCSKFQLGYTTGAFVRLAVISSHTACSQSYNRIPRARNHIAACAALATTIILY